MRNPHIDSYMDKSSWITILTPWFLFELFYRRQEWTTKSFQNGITFMWGTRSYSLGQTRYKHGGTHIWHRVANEVFEDML